MIGDFLYGLQPQEAVSAPVLQRVADRRLISAAALAHSFEWQLPKDRAFMLLEAHLDARAGGGQLVQVARAYIRTSTATPIHLMLLALPPGGIATVNLVGPTSPLLLMPQERLFFEASFDLAVGQNQLEVTFIGLLLPRGTLQLGGIERL